MIVPVLSLQEIKLPQIPKLSAFDPFLCRSVEFLLITSRKSGRPGKDASVRCWVFVPKDRWGHWDQRPTTGQHAVVLDPTLHPSEVPSLSLSLYIYVFDFIY